jgi:hypothetical protein
MKTTALITMLVLGTTTAAMASPSVTVSYSASARVSMGGHRTPAPITVRDHRDQPRTVRYEEPRWSPRPVQQPSWKTLATSLNFAGSDGRKFIEVPSKTALSTIRITGTSGRPYIQQAIVTFADGSYQQFSGVYETLTRGEFVDLTLSSKQRVAMVTIWTDDSGQIFQQNTGAFSVTAR